MSVLDHLPLDWVVDVNAVPAKGMVWQAAATPEQRAAIVSALDLSAVSSLSVAGRIDPVPGGTYRLKARLTAHVLQTCVVTLEPVATIVDEPLRIEFRDVEAFEADLAQAPDIEAEYDVEPIIDGGLDCGRVVFEQFAAALDPYPRAPGAEIGSVEAAPRGAVTKPTNPFAALAKLKDKKDS